MLIKELTELSGVSGCEYEVRDFIKAELIKIGCPYKVDKLGNVIAYNEGIAGRKIVLSAHMDEVGLIVYAIDEEGFVRFKTVGDLDPVVLNSKLVEIGKNRITGVVGSNPVHLMKQEDRGKVFDTDSLYIDIGAKNKEEAKKYVRIGDYAVVKSSFTEFGSNKIKGKALGGRAGCSILLEMLKEKSNVDFYCVFTVLKEVGKRGIQTAIFSLEPDIIVTLDETECADTPDNEAKNRFTELGKGVAVSFMDDNVVYDEELTRKYMKLACEKGINHQIKESTRGLNDAETACCIKNSSRALSLLLPCRNPNSPVTVADVRDYDSMISYARMIVEN